MNEIKYRGPLNRKQLKQLRTYLLKHGKPLASNFEQVVFFDTSIFPQIGDFNTGFSRLSLRSTPTHTALRIKQGNPSDHERNEIAVAIKKKDCQKVLYILNQLGLTYGYYRPVHRQDFSLEKCIISIKTQCVMGNHFEIELKKGASLESPKINFILKNYLNFWTKDKYQERINEKMQECTAVNVFESNLWS